MRKLIDGTEIESYDAPINLTIHTKAPTKWKLIDMETGQEYVGQANPNKYGKWLRIKDREKNNEA
jgi:hypothetical protein